MAETRHTPIERSAQSLWDISADLAFMSDAQSLLPTVSEKIAGFFQADRLAFVDVDDVREMFSIAYDYHASALELYTNAEIGHEQLSQYFSKAVREKLGSGDAVAIDDLTTDS